MRGPLEISRYSNIFTIIVTDEPVRLIGRNDKRRALFLQNQDLADAVEFCTVSGQNPGFILPATGAFLSDIALTEEIWARNTTVGGSSIVCIMESMGYDAYETETLTEIRAIRDTIQDIRDILLGSKK